MQVIETISQRSLREAVETAVRDMIVDGRLIAGERVNEVHLSERLGVSRTPLREALNRLAHEGALEERARHGYFVKALSVDECHQIYDVRPILDPAALRMASAPDHETLDALKHLNELLLGAKSAKAAMELDDEWHLLLIAHCPNRVLVELIESFMMRTRRYELALMREKQNVQRANADHERILAALRGGDMDQACASLEHNLRSGKAAIVNWLDGRETK